MGTSYLKLMNENLFDQHDFDVIKERTEQGATYRIKGPYFLEDTENDNGRTYPADVLRPEIKSFLENKAKKNLATACGELEHSDQPYVNLERVCHRITNLYLDDKNKGIWLGESVVLVGTPHGDIVKALIDSGTKLGMSSRGVGQLQDDKSTRGPVTQYKYITTDCVSDPSIGKFVDGILESKEFLINRHGAILEAKFVNLEESLEKLPKSKEDRDKFVNEVFKHFLKSI